MTSCVWVELCVCEQVVCELSCVWASCVSWVVCEQVVCELSCVWVAWWQVVCVMTGGGGRRRKEEKDTEPKTRTPHKDVGKNEAILRDFLNFRHWQHQKRGYSARLPQFLNLTTSKTKQFCETSLIFEVDNIKNETILRDFLNFRTWQHQKRSNSARLPHLSKLATSKTKHFCDTSSMFELVNVKNEVILRDFLNFRSWQHQKRSNSARRPSKMESWVQSWRPRTNASSIFSIPPV